jgi:hypothetical protein
MKSRAQQPLWFSIASLAEIYDWSPRTIRKWVKEGAFGDPKDTRFVIERSHVVRVSSLGTFFFESNHPHRYDAEARARNREAVRRRMEAAKKPAEFFALEEAHHG